MFRLNSATELTCDRCRLWMNDYVEDTLPTMRQETVCAHLDACAACSALAHDFARLQTELRALPRPQTSESFEAALLARLNGAPVRTRTTARGAMRPLLALGACAAAIGGLMLVHPASPVTPIVPAAPAVDLSLVGHCVAQHRAEVDTQPLADPSARVLSDHLTDASAGMGDSGL